MNTIEQIKCMPMIVLEIGCNHMGNIELAKKMIYCAAKECGASAAKFQKRNNFESLTEAQRNAPHPHPENSYGKTYGEHRDFLEFTIDQHKELKDYCDELGIIYSSSVWDLTSAKEIASLNPQYIKIPAAQNNNIPMLTWLCENYYGECQISLGMTTEEEEKRIVELFSSYNRLKDLSILACTSGYPITYEESCLCEIVRIKKMYGDKIKSVGLSGHYTAPALDVAAYVLGAEIIERHFTFDKLWKGTDHSASMVPDEVIQMISNLNDVRRAMSYKEGLLPVEIVQREKLKYKV